MIQNVKKIIYVLLVLTGVVILSIYGLSSYINSSTKDKIFENIADVPDAYTVIVLGASVRPNGNLSMMLEDRVRSALQLYEAGKVQRFLLSGDNSTKNYNEPQAMKEFLIAKGIPEDLIFLDYAGFDTYDSMYRARSVFKITNAIVVTQEFHLPRTIYIANKLDLDYYGYVGDRHIYERESINKKREVLANVKAFIELAIGKEPTFLGADIPIDGPPQSSYPAE